MKVEETIKIRQRKRFDIMTAFDEAEEEMQYSLRNHIKGVSARDIQLDYLGTTLTKMDQWEVAEYESEFKLTFEVESGEEG